MKTEDWIILGFWILLGINSGLSWVLARELRKIKRSIWYKVLEKLETHEIDCMITRETSTTYWEEGRRRRKRQISRFHSSDLSELFKEDDNS